MSRRAELVKLRPAFAASLKQLRSSRLRQQSIFRYTHNSIFRGRKKLSVWQGTGLNHPSSTRLIGAWIVACVFQVSAQTSLFKNTVENRNDNCEK